MSIYCYHFDHIIVINEHISFDNIVNFGLIIIIIMNSNDDHYNYKLEMKLMNKLKISAYYYL